MSSRPPQVRREVVGLGLLFGALYFAQGIGEPTEGLIAQPVRSLLKSWGHSATQIGLVSFIISLPWMVKPLYGLLTDFVPWLGYRRRSYLIASSLTAAGGLAALWLLPLGSDAIVALVAILLLTTTGVAFSDVVVDALMVERGQRHGLTGRFQSIQWAAAYLAMILTGVVGGRLSGLGMQRSGFLICAGAMSLTLALAVLFVREPRERQRPQFRAALAALKAAAGTPALLAAGGFIFLWNFNPFSTDVLYVHMTREMGLSEEFYGTTVSLMAAASVAASVAYGFYCRRVPLRWLIHSAIVLGILSTAGYWAMVDRATAVAVSIAIGFTYMTANLIQFDLAAQVCPAEVGGTAFALLMSLSNLSLGLSAAVGGWLYDRGVAQFGSQITFNGLVLLGAAFTAGCWALVPVLLRATQRADRPQ